MKKKCYGIHHVYTIPIYGDKTMCFVGFCTGPEKCEMQLQKI